MLRRHGRPHRRLRSHRLHRPAGRRAAGRRRASARCWRGARRSGCATLAESPGRPGDRARPTSMRQQLGLRAGRARRRARLHRRPVRQVGRARRARGDRRRLRPTSTRPASRRSSGACSRSSAPPAERAGRAAADRDGLRLRAGRAGGRAGARGGGRGRGARRRRLLRARDGPPAVSAGTRESLVGVTLDDEPRVPRRRACGPSAPAERVRSFTVAGKEREAISVGGAEHFGAAGRVSGAARGQRLPRLVRPAGAAAAGGRAGRLGRARGSRACARR